MTAMGRPTRFEPEMCEQAHNYCLLGAINDELAEFFGVSPSTIDRWIAQHPDFGDAVKSGRIVADSKVARGLYARAVGYERKVEREVILGGELRPVTSTVHYPPNVQPASSGCATAAARPGVMRPTIRPSKSTTLPCSTPPVKACAIMTVIEFPTPAKVLGDQARACVTRRRRCAGADFCLH